MNEAPQFLKAWIVQRIVVLPENRGVEVTFAVAGRDPFSFRTRKFGVGRRGAKSAALAKFASHAGFGEAEAIFDYLCGLPCVTVGGILPFPLTPETAPEATPLRCFWPDESVA